MTHTGKRTHGNNGTERVRPHSFGIKNGLKSLYSNGCKGLRTVGKDEVTSSNLVSSSRTTPEIFGFRVFSFDFGNFLNEYGFADFH